MGNAPREGDVVLTHIPGGFLVGQLLPELGPGPWWTYVGTAASLHDAIQMARRASLNARAWLVAGVDDWHELPLDAEYALG